ncbi:hypothetical protein PoB_007720800 [Plakobranchus ocellatus]|uniref:Uncharacterized protein n=1 Tax=Plakobranchus ocellatus TaxID=259542 RepID=A0AAV4E2B6_9GAST|nr:hypothetical protein PoB_007720800 [Plakobranchus ocellatus]
MSPAINTGGGASVAQWLASPPEICRGSSNPATGALTWRRARKSEITFLWTGYIQKPASTLKRIQMGSLKKTDESCGKTDT